jgi:hypothetical protein
MDGRRKFPAAIHPPSLPPPLPPSFFLRCQGRCHSPDESHFCGPHGGSCRKSPVLPPSLPISFPPSLYADKKRREERGENAEEQAMESLPENQCFFNWTFGAGLYASEASGRKEGREGGRKEGREGGREGGRRGKRDRTTERMRRAQKFSRQSLKDDLHCRSFPPSLPPSQQAC